MFMIVLYYITTLAAFFVSLLSFRNRAAKSLRLLSCYLGCNVLLEFYMLALMRKNVTLSIFIMNICNLLEFAILGIFFYHILSFIKLRRFVINFLIGYLIFWLVFVFCNNGMSLWKPFPLTAGSSMAVISAVVYYYQLITSRKIIKLQTHPEFWIATGIILNYSFLIPFSAMHDFIFSRYFQGAATLFIFLRILPVIMYSLFIYAYICSFNQNKCLQQSSQEVLCA